MLNQINQIIYKMGLVSCGCQGCDKSRSHKGIFKSTVFCALVMSFYGGMLRDVIALRVHPWLLTMKAIPDIILVILTSRLYCIVKNKQLVSKRVLANMITITDGLGLACFIRIGCDKAILLRKDFAITLIASGYLTGVGGGAFLVGSLTGFLETKTILYHVITLSASCLYLLTRSAIAIYIYIGVATYFMYYFSPAIPLTRIPLVVYHINTFQKKVEWLSFYQLKCFHLGKYKPYLRRQLKYFFFSRLRYC